MDIFKDKTPMPPMDNSPDVVRVAQTMSEKKEDYMPAATKNSQASVRNVARPRFGHGY